MTTSPPPTSEVALVDANVLFPHHPRNIFVTLATERVFEMRWTGTIEREWTEALLRERPDLRREAVMATAQKMKQALPNAAVAGFEDLIPDFPKTDPKDRHVAAAAATCAPSVLVTWNRKHFDRDELAAHKVELADPDSFLCRQYDADPEVVFAATERAFGFLKRPAGHPTWDEYLDLLGGKNGLSGFAERLRSFGMRDNPSEPDDGNGLVP